MEVGLGGCEERVSSEGEGSLEGQRLRFGGLYFAIKFAIKMHLMANPCPGVQHVALRALKEGCAKYPVFTRRFALSEGKKVVGWLGLEPRTNGLKGRCSTD